MMCRHALVWVLSLWPGSALSQTFETIEDFSFIQDSANYNNDHVFFSTVDSVLVDGSVTSFPPDRTTFDRTFVNILRLGYTHKFNSRFALRPVVDSRFIIHKIHEEEQPRNVEEESYYETRNSLDLVFILQGGMELFGGVSYWYFPEYTAKTRSVSFEAEARFGDLTMWVPRVGLLRRSQMFKAGVFYIKGTEKNRAVEKKSSDGATLNAEDMVYSPTELGLFVQMDVNGYVTDLEFAAVQAGSGGPTAGESRTKVLEDYTRGRLGVFIPWSRNDLNFHARIVHKTLSYAGSDFVTLETLPMTTLHFKVINGNAEKHFYYGLLYGYTKDTQSTEEFNQKYVVNNFGGKLGLNWSF